MILAWIDFAFHRITKRAELFLERRARLNRNLLIFVAMNNQYWRIGFHPARLISSQCRFPRIPQQTILNQQLIQRDFVERRKDLAVAARIDHRKNLLGLCGHHVVEIQRWISGLQSSSHHEHVPPKW